MITLANVFLVVAVALIVGGAAGWFVFIMGVRGCRMAAEESGSCPVCKDLDLPATLPERRSRTLTELESLFQSFLMTLSGEQLTRLLLALEPHQQQSFAKVVQAVVSRGERDDVSAIDHGRIR